MMSKINEYSPNWDRIARDVKAAAKWRCEYCSAEHGKSPHVLTVHHVNFNKGDNTPSNLIALCQRCHLKVQAWRVQPLTRYDILIKLQSHGRQLSML